MNKKKLLVSIGMVSALLVFSAAPMLAEEGDATGKVEEAVEASVSETVITEAPGTEAPGTEASDTEATDTEAPDIEQMTEASETEAAETEETVTEAPVTESETEDADTGEMTEVPGGDETEMSEPYTEVSVETEETAGQTETAIDETEDLFLYGYAKIKKDTVLYREKCSAEAAEQGLFIGESYVYVLERALDDGDGNPENDWMRIAFAVMKDDGTVEEAEGYARANQILPEAASETETLTVSLSQGIHICYQGNNQIVLVPAAYKIKEEAEETEGEELTPYMISACWENDTLGFGDTVTLIAECGAEETVFWQSSGNGTEWITIAEGQTYSFELAEDNYQMFFRAVPAKEEA